MSARAPKSMTSAVNGIGMNHAFIFCPTPQNEKMTPRQRKTSPSDIRCVWATRAHSPIGSPRSIAVTALTRAYVSRGRRTPMMPPGAWHRRQWL